MPPVAYTYNPAKPHTTANFPLLGNPNTHFYRTRSLPILGGVNHITVGSDDYTPPDTSIEGSIRYGATTSTPASWTGGCDSDSIVDCLPDTYTAFAQGVKGHSFNSPFLSLEMGKNTTKWDVEGNARDLAILENAAWWWAPRVIRYSLPIRYVLDRNQIDYLIARKGKVGFTDHYILSPTNRSDPGLYKGVNTFPRDHFLALVTEYVAKLRSGEKVVVPPTPPTPVPSVPPVSAALVRDGRLGPATIRRWQAVMGTHQDGVISASGSSLVRAVQTFLNAQKGVTDSRGRRLVVDGQGILPNLSRNYGPTHTVWALQDYLGTYKDGVLSSPSSGAIKVLQDRLNKAKTGSRKF